MISWGGVHIGKWLILSAATLFATSYGFAIPDNFAQDVKDVGGKGGKIWVVLVAGSNGYFNYRHQAGNLNRISLLCTIAT